MKKRVLLFVMVVAMIVSAFTFAITSFAACTSSTSSANIARNSAVTTTSDAGEVIVGNLTDGTARKGTFTRSGSFSFIFTANKNLRSVGLYLNDTQIKVYKVTGYNSDSSPIYEETTTTAKVGRVKIQYYSDLDQLLWDSGEIDVSTKSGLVTITSPDVYSAKKVTVHIYDHDSYGWSALGEVYIYEGSGTHDWKLDKSISTTEQPYQAADCVNNGMGTYKCECGATKYDVIYSTGHEFGSFRVHPDDPTKHAATCLRGSEGKCSEPAGTLFSVADHEYDNECDTTCNVCSAVRDVEDHLYVSDCDVHCNKCNLLRQPANGAQHAFTYNCTPECEDCREPNPNWVDHTYTSDCDPDCNFCGLERIVNPHVYNSKCDETCNVPNCGYVRNTVSDPTLIPHTYTADCDTHCNNDNCVYVRQPLMEHPFKNKCDKNCDKCNELNPDYIEGHIYDNDCDGDCNECKQKRNVDDHKYDNVCDIDCNTCGAQRTVSKHIYGDWIILVPAAVGSDGMRAHYCVNCDKEETEIIPMIVKTGLETGVIVLIVVGCVVVVGGCTGIGVYSLVIKPKMDEKKRLEAEAAKRKAEEEDEEYEDEE